MTTFKRDKNPYIVDNSISGWQVHEYLRKWTEFTGELDIATGYFEIGALLKLDGAWQKIDNIRILMGNEVTYRTRNALLEALKRRLNSELELSVEEMKDSRPLLSGVEAIRDALERGKIEVRVFDEGKFHAKCYITHERTGFFGPQALVGSSNFTAPGLTDNVELNIHVQTGNDVEELQNWFEYHWEKGKDVSKDVLKIITKHIRLYTPFEVYAKALHEYCRGDNLTADEWEQTQSKMFKELDRYQKEAYWSMIKIAQQHSGAFLCDGVGLGKTYVGLMLIERLVIHEKKRVVLLAPKSARESVWDKDLDRWLPHVKLDGVFSNLAVYNHTDLTRDSLRAQFEQAAAVADVVIVDEAHHFRNTGQVPNYQNNDVSRYYRLQQLIDGSTRTNDGVSGGKPKQVYLLTATPINNSISDFRHLIELFTPSDTAFAKTLGVNSLKTTFNMLERELRDVLAARGEKDATDIGDEASTFIRGNRLFRALVVQRSRAYARASQMAENKNTLLFPNRKPPVVQNYALRDSYGKLFTLFENAFQTTTQTAQKPPLFTLAMYNPTPYARNKSAVDEWEANRNIAVVGLIRTSFLKRFESSIIAFEMSSIRLFLKLRAFVTKHATSKPQQDRHKRWETMNAAVITAVIARHTELLATTDDELDEDKIMDEIRGKVPTFSDAAYEIGAMLEDSRADMDMLLSFLQETANYDVRHDDKVNKLIELLKSTKLAKQKVIIFSEFADTAQYIARQLIAAGIDGVEQIDSSSSSDRNDVITRFAPYYNRSSSNQLRAKGRTPIRVLVSTDVLSEGLNLQDATFLINYDIHWNPVRLMQRIGRVDRRLNPAVEHALKTDHPEVAALRGSVTYWNFLPPKELNKLLSLYERVTNRTIMISEVLGIEGGKLITEEDKHRAIAELNAGFDGITSEEESLRLEYQKLLTDYPTLEAELNALPLTYSGKTSTTTTKGIFFCYALPAYDTVTGDYTHAAGTVRWYLYDVETQKILESATEIATHIRADRKTPRVFALSESQVIDIRKKVLTYIKNDYLRKIDAPQGVNAKLRCWMALQ